MNDSEKLEECAHYLNALINALELAERMGNEIDKPEGTRYIIISDTLTDAITSNLKRVCRTVWEISQKGNNESK